MYSSQQSTDHLLLLNHNKMSSHMSTADSTLQAHRTRVLAPYAFPCVSVIEFYKCLRNATALEASGSSALLWTAALEVSMSSGLLRTAALEAPVSSLLLQTAALEVPASSALLRTLRFEQRAFSLQPYLNRKGSERYLHACSRQHHSLTLCSGDLKSLVL